MKEETYPKCISYGQFDFDEILDEFRSGKKLTGKGGLLAPLIKQLTESALEAEVESRIANDVLSSTKNRSNGSNRKTIKGTGDGLSGFPQAINSIFPQTEVQLCIVHQI